MNPKSFFIIFMMAIAIFFVAFTVQCLSSSKDSIIVKETDKKLLVRKYDVKIHINKNLKSFYCKIDSSLWKYPKNKILYDGQLVKAEHSPHKVILKVTRKEYKNGKTYKITTNKNVTEYFSCNQVEEFEGKIGKRIIITKSYFPKKRIFYKFP
jgi:hypothetical protein